MVKVLIFLVLLLLPVHAQAQVEEESTPEPKLEYRGGNTMVIKEDYGGAMISYMIRYQQMHQQKFRLAIDGPCYSSCTLFFGYLGHDDVCITENAKLGFHRASRPEGTMVMMMKYPELIVMWLLSEGITEDIKFLPDPIMHAMFEKCPDQLINPPSGEKVD